VNTLKRDNHILKGSLFALAAFFCMAVFGVLTKIAYQNGSAIWVSFITYFSGTLILIPFILKGGIESLKSNHYPYLIGRAVFGTAASFLYMLSLHYIPLVNATLLFNTAPIFIPFLAIYWIRAHISKTVWAAIALGFLGIIVIIRPTAEIFTQSGNLIALASGLSLAIAYFQIKLLAGSDPGARIIFYYLGIGALMQLPLLLFAGPLPALDSCLISVACGVVMVLAQFALVEAYLFADASQVGVYQYSSVVFVGLIDWLIWNQVPSKLDLLGVLLVMIAGTMIIYSGNMINKKK
jgi:drug/metabolite transporter (DMT)-like permease